MATLEIDLNCMCLFVPDPHAGTNTGTVHVLMPQTCCNGEDRHVLRMRYRDREANVVMRPMEGWALVLGTQPGEARTTLDPKSAARSNGEEREEGEVAKIVDLTALTAHAESGRGRAVSRSLLEGAHAAVVSRISFHAGEVISVAAQNDGWILGEESVIMAHKVTWRIEDASMDFLEGQVWINLNSTEPPPLDSLRMVKPHRVNGKEVFRLSVHHVTEKVLRTKNGASRRRVPGFGLNPEEIQRHFRMFYKLLDIRDPDEELLPKLPDQDASGGAPEYACKVGQASLQPAA
jgi:hypothetical protein